ncbi:MAG TPA: hypothetical protein VMU39_04485 [Solirubrobacteraceae bacterium]|jgi:hypothetical protein|nr:hypothetical protein [Solirubrobacteraceae bacterium]
MEKVQTLVKTRPEASARALILFAAFVSFVISVVLWFGGHRQEGIFVGIWVPSILSLGAIVLRRGER